MSTMVESRPRQRNRKRRVGIEQALKIEPKDKIKFPGPYTRSVTEYVYLINPTEKWIAFKVKTAAPLQYSVRPVSGMIGPGQYQTVTIMLQPLLTSDNGKPSDDGDEFVLAKQKFMILSAYVKDGEAKIASDVLKRARENRNELMDTRLRCVFDDDELSKLTCHPIIDTMMTNVGDKNDSSVKHQLKTPIESEPHEFSWINTMAVFLLLFLINII